jgi:hypothetical protein
MSRDGMQYIVLLGTAIDKSIYGHRGKLIPNQCQRAAVRKLKMDASMLAEDATYVARRECSRLYDVRGFVEHV